MIAGRFRIIERLGRGATASVYRVFDQATDKAIALKQLSKKASGNPHNASLFKQEFYTLAQLAHPRIIEVYDFGVDPKGPYYTMELLDGEDFKILAPLEWKASCALLRDVASSLTLLHSRRLIHRDVSSRNLRCTKDGRAKLIDFGAMAPFGTPLKVIGTPAFIAPEALNRQPLDQRVDLYALGALAYWLMTERHAYRAQTIAYLQDAWRSQPTALSELNPEIPPALNDLVMSLLSLDRMARPFSASEVVEKLEASAGLKRDDTLEVKQSYLTTPRLVGRGKLIRELRALTLDAAGGHIGKNLMFEGVNGIGRSRLLSELALEGKVIGTTVLTVGADLGTFEAYGVAWKLVEQLFENASDLTAEAIEPHIALLSGVFPGLRTVVATRTSRQTESLLDSGTNSTRWQETTQTENQDDSKSITRSNPIDQKSDLAIKRGNIQKALLDLFLTVSEQRRLLIAIDDLHRVDEPSAALLSALAMKSRTHGFILALTIETDATPIAPDACALMSGMAQRVEIEELDLQATEDLLRSIFGEGANRRLLADRIYAISRGNPRAAICLAQHLVDQGRVRFQAGAWTLPESINAAFLPGSLAEALAVRVRKLSAGARTIAQRVALAYDQQFTFDECLALSGHRDAAKLTIALNELVAFEVLKKDESLYKLSQTGWVLPLIETLDEDARCAGHLLLADLFDIRGVEQFQVVQHLFRAGEDERAIDRLIRHVRESRQRFESDMAAYTEYIISLPNDWIDTCNDAIELCERLNRPKIDKYWLRTSIVHLAFSTGAQDRGHFTEIIAQLYRDSGLEFYYELDDSMDAGERLNLALHRAQHQYDTTCESEKGLSPIEAIRSLTTFIIIANTFSSVSYDNQLLDSLPSLEPFEPLSPAIGLLRPHTLAARCAISGRFEQSKELYREMLDMITQPDHLGIKDSTHEMLRLSLTYGIGMTEAAMGLGTALMAADEIESDPLNQANAWRIRMIYHLRLGEAEQAERCRQTLELLQIQNSPSQTFKTVHVFAALLSYALYDDLKGVIQMIVAIEKNTRRFPGWVPFLHFAQGEYHRIRSDYVESSRKFEQVLNSISAGRHAAWPFAAGAYLRTLFGLDRLSDGEKLGREYLIAAEQQKLGYPTNLIRMPLALIEAKLGKRQSAQDLAEDAIANWNALGITGVYLGLAYETRARVAIFCDDPKTFRAYAHKCGELWRAGEDTFLIAKHQKLLQDARQAYLGMSQEIKQASKLAKTFSRTGDMVSAVRTHLNKYHDYDAFIEGALDLLIKRTGGKEGYLYLLRKGELTLAAQKAKSALPQPAVRAMEDAFERSPDDEDATDNTETRTETDMRQSTDAESRVYEPIVLSVKVEGLRTPIGVVVLVVKDRYLYQPDSAFFRAVAFCILEAERKGVNLGQFESKRSNR